MQRVQMRDDARPDGNTIRLLPGILHRVRELIMNLPTRARARRLSRFTMEIVPRNSRVIANIAPDSIKYQYRIKKGRA